LSLKVELVPAPVRNSDEIERAVASLARDANGGVILLPSIFTSDHRKEIVALAARHRVPAMYPYRISAAEGGLVSYGIDIVDQFRGAASYVDRILKGEKPAGLPVQAATKFQLIINMKTASTLGINVPLSLQQIADEVIE